uniref:Uncharacterized protein n=1 Tax=Triticum urartu TaxID=4572 RepID=A0A8R7UJC8_TRIUA
MVSTTAPASATPLILLIPLVHKTGRYLKCGVPLGTRHPPAVLHCIVSVDLRVALEDNKLLGQTRVIFAEEVIFPKMHLQIIVVAEIIVLPRMPPLTYVARVVVPGHMRVKLIISIECPLAILANRVSRKAAAFDLGAIHLSVPCLRVPGHLFLRVELLLTDEHLPPLQAKFAHAQPMLVGQMPP